MKAIHTVFAVAFFALAVVTAIVNITKDLPNGGFIVMLCSCNSVFAANCALLAGKLRKQELINRLQEIKDQKVT